MWSDYESWARVMGVVLIAFCAADIVVFAFEFKAHRWSRAAIAEAVALGIFVFLGLGDWHLQTLANEHDKEVTASIALAKKEASAASEDSDAATKAAMSARAESDAAKVQISTLEKEVEPFLKIAKVAYPRLDADASLQHLADEIQTIRSRTDRLDEKSDVIEHRIQRRSLDARQAAIIVATLKKHGPGAIKVVTVMGNADSDAYARDIEGALRSAGWTVDTEQGAFVPHAPVGLVLKVADAKAPPSSAIAFGLALRAAGIAFDPVAVGLQALKTSETDLVVGVRPDL